MHRLALEMLAQCRTEEQAARRVPDDAEAERIRSDVRHLAREEGLRIRTARLEDTVVVVRVDARIWHENAATMRTKLAPPD